MSNILGFSTEPSKGGDFLPILKYDARAGRFFRVDRIDVGGGKFESAPTDITQVFKAVADFQHLEVGWIHFPPGSPPNFRLVPWGSQFPERPSNDHKHGARFLVKLAKDIDDQPVREIAGTALSFLGGVQEIFEQYKAETTDNRHQLDLPVLTLEKTIPVTTGSGVKTSTNYKPVFKIAAWVPRGNFPLHPRTANDGKQRQTTANVGNGAAPATGGQSATAPGAAPAGISAADFG